jgi:Tfp pilus assembly protein PilO
VKGKSASQNALTGAIVAAVLVAGLAAWLLIVHPQSGEAGSLDRQARVAQEKIDTYRPQVTAARSAPEIEVADVHRLEKALPTSARKQDAVLELTHLARDSGIRVGSISPQAVTAVGGYSVLPVFITFDGNYYNLADFLYRVRSLVTLRAGRLDATGRLFSVDRVNFSETDTKFPHIHASLVIDAFVYRSH